MMKCEWILCPVCGSKTRNKIRKDTVLENYPLYCPKCRQERLKLSTSINWSKSTASYFENCCLSSLINTIS
ncbi:cysteine-rich KTR domain-containing protein [Streptococcus suis]|uniref:cysteine-rich KTR domain-containing protein n=1 Tax=Streptococcus suis TaxID=1307 RepID=UPI0021AB937C|nr:cysteine-rich KTR domain-containing protein [Streptococcus suis]